MSDQTNGLRFDVYERVHLPDDVAAIDELEEIELVPRIQVIDQGDHAVLRGQLLLSGVYRSQNDSENSLTLEHWIPVEITLPMNRISRLDDISIEIDNFDVDLLSARTLNITGVLSLRGISAQPVQEHEEIWREEPFTVVHQREAFDERTAEFFYNQNAANEQPYILPEEQQFAAQEEIPYLQQPELSDESEATVTISSIASESGWSSSQLFATPGQQAEEEEAELADEREITLASQQTSSEGWLATSSTFANAAPNVEQNEYEFIGSQPAFDQEREEQESEPEANEPPPSPFAEALPPQRIEPEPEKQELRIALTGKQPQDGTGSPADVGILTLLQTSRREQAVREAAEQVIAQQRADEQARVQASGDEIEWKNLFLGKRSEDTEFRKIRMCIVQRDETLDVIASRYSLNPREILIYNRLDDSGVSEGQLLYIP
ncbi:LysM peptidoglycan-binding domain-containing protein [Paenibacillus sp. LHD-38]|uniref:LysM peptidoglycan-binding domain-containing protein n=1 Tax=Paenibacillus sp. LHD-38 TaxID=3072143 RepID=UPI00280D9E62|nr:LysM peptidoglycan-binding domain-containing protein [Paenibacillus sp. LHD-38]MDQ8737411.1 LysM peptidoglycan-binding domain-containing protein [Paenibacillus sp. LHD-38]